MSRFLIPFLFLLTACGTAKQPAAEPEPGPATIAELDAALDKTFAKATVAGVSTVVVDTSGVIYRRSFGKADLASGRAFDEHTVLNIASISKTFLAVAMMKAVDQGLLSLDDDVNDYLDFPVTNPYFPGSKITIRHLLTHTSSISDTKAYAHAYYFPTGRSLTKEQLYDMWRYRKFIWDNELLDDSELLRQTLAPDGRFYNSKIYQKKHAPGTTAEYSNTAASLGSLVLEGATGMPYEDYTRREIFAPLGMTESWWEGETLPAARMSKRYYSPTLPVPDYTLLTIADGGLKTSTADLAKYTFEMIKGYRGGGTILSEASYKIMFSPQVDNGHGGDFGMIWDLPHAEPGFNHNGGDPGVITNLVYDKEKQRAVVMISNTQLSGTTAPLLFGIWRTVEEFDFPGTPTIAAEK